MFEPYIGKMIRPDYSVHITRDGDEYSGTCQAADGALDNLADLNIRYSEKLFVQNALFEGEVE